METKSKRQKPLHYAVDFGLDPLSGDDDLFRWFLLAYLFGKPIQSKVAANTWKIFKATNVLQFCK